MSGAKLPFIYDRKINNPSISQGILRELRIGIMLHVDASTSDTGSLAWFRDPRCECAYHCLVMDNGEAVSIVPHDRRAWHAGKCHPADGFNYRDANSAFYGIAAAARVGDSVTNAQLSTIARACKEIMNFQGWLNPHLWITTHSAQAWPRGRKTDPECDFTNPVFTKEMVIDRIRRFDA